MLKEEKMTSLGMLWDEIEDMGHFRLDLIYFGKVDWHGNQSGFGAKNYCGFNSQKDAVSSIFLIGSFIDVFKTLS